MSKSNIHALSQNYLDAGDYTIALFEKFLRGEVTIELVNMAHRAEGRALNAWMEDYETYWKDDEGNPWRKIVES